MVADVLLHWQFHSVVVDVVASGRDDGGYRQRRDDGIHYSVTSWY